MLTTWKFFTIFLERQYSIFTDHLLQYQRMSNLMHSCWNIDDWLFVILRRNTLWNVWTIKFVESFLKLFSTLEQQVCIFIHCISTNETSNIRLDVNFYYNNINPVYLGILYFDKSFISADSTSGHKYRSINFSF